MIAGANFAESEQILAIVTSRRPHETMSYSGSHECLELKKTRPRKQESN